MHRQLYLFIIILVSSITSVWMNAASQAVKAYESISTAEGLSQGMIFDMLQDKEGFIWAATNNGLNRYDGYQFKVFTNDPYNPHSLSRNTILKLFEDSKGRIWAGTENAGVNIYNKKNGKFYRISQNGSGSAGLSGNEIKGITEMADGRILVATDNKGLDIVHVTDSFFENDAAPFIVKLQLPNNTAVYGMGKDKNNNMWIGGMDGVVYRFDATNNSFVPSEGAQFLFNGYFVNDENILINNNLYLYDGNNITPLFDTVESPKGNIIFKTNSPLWDKHHREHFHYDVSEWGNGKSLQWNKKLPPATRLIYPFIFDRSGIAWSGTVGYGLRKFNTTSSKFKVQIPGYSVRFIVPVSGGDIFLGDFAYGWRKLGRDSVTTNPFNKIASIKQIDNFIAAKTGDYWIKSDNSGYYKYNPLTNRLTAYPQINFYGGWGDKQPMMEDSRGNVWMPGLGGKFTIINIATEKIDSFSINTDAAKPLQAEAVCTALYEDKQGVYWIATREGFAKLSFTGDKISLPQVKWFYNNSSDRNSLNYNHVSCFMDDPAEPNKYLWVCTKGGGLNRLDKNSNDFFHLTTKEGLVDDVVYGILADDAGNIWGSTNKGIFCMSAVKQKSGNSWVFRNFTKANGLQHDEFNTAAYAKLSNGNLAFGGVNGLNIFDPKEILTPGFTPSVFITDILINNQAVATGDNSNVLTTTIEQSKEITLTYLQDILTLEFSSLDFTAPEQNKYRYQLVGVDKEWVESGTRRTATYLHLPAGAYTFKVQGSNSQGIWSDKIAQLKITVLPPWWGSWWAYLGYALLVVLGVRAYFRFTINREKLKAQLNVEQLEAKRIKELDSVKTQLYTNITHEFRTPLTVILGMAQQVKTDPAAHLDNGMNMIIRNGQSLLNLVNEMLDLSKLETGKMELQLIHGDVVNFLRYIVESFHSLAESQKKQLHFLSEVDALHTAYDPEKLRQIVANLLSNALKFTPEKGNVYISIVEQPVPGEKGRSTLIIKVKDTGIGIPENQLQHIFDRFYQLDNSHTRKADGTGIGLALTKELVKLMEGEITVKSPPTGANKGSEFTVLLPVTKSHGIAEYPDTVHEDNMYQKEFTPVSSSPITGDKQAGSRPLILLVEDNADVVAYTASCLPDYRLAVGKDGREGFEIAAEMIPDLIITDVMMPFVDGFELCRRLRADERTSHIPVIMLTAKAGFESKMEGLLQGADAYLEKPFNREELLIRIKKLLELRQSLQQHYLNKAGLNNTSLSMMEEAIVSEDPALQNQLEDEFVQKVRMAVEANLSNAEFTIEQLCRLVFMSHSQLHRKLDALTGCSPNKFIRIIRLNKAKEMLKQPANSIATIAYECGYNDPGYFARVFKQEYGETPQEWRTSNL
ncbi:MAG TPA: ATP-binding protein [Ferruginibacter sp.]|nr:ATP-binding protein [Ferruginibacter sp.]HPH92745.1 ATP-binding protein [Ferruginibacter sp.]